MASLSFKAGPSPLKRAATPAQNSTEETLSSTESENWYVSKSIGPLKINLKYLNADLKIRLLFHLCGQHQHNMHTYMILISLTRLAFNVIRELPDIIIGGAKIIKKCFELA